MEIKNLKKSELLKLKDDIDTQLEYIENINNNEIYINPNDNTELKNKSKNKYKKI